MDTNNKTESRSWHLRWLLFIVAAALIAIPIIIFTLPMILLPGHPPPPRITHVIVAPNGPVAGALDRFKLDVGKYPARLIDLAERPAGDEDAGRWHGPYIKNIDDLKDAWGNTLHYRCPGTKHADGYDLWSIGSDSEDGTDDDITNWETSP
jgi:type II secretion system protein G